MRRHFIPVIPTLLLIVSGLFMVDPAHGVTLGCNSILTASVVLDADIGPCGSDGILLLRPDLTLDLNGHTIRGGPDTGHVGVYVSSSARNSTVKNGTITGFDTGVLLDYGTRENTITNLRLVDNIGNLGTANSITTGEGIQLYGSHDNLIARNVIARNGPVAGITALASSRNTIIENVVENNSQLREFRDPFLSFEGTIQQDIGIIVVAHRVDRGGSDNVIQRNLVRGNGLDGILVGEPNTPTVGRIRSPGVDGALTTRNVVRDNVVYNNGFGQATPQFRKGDGIRVSGIANVVEGNNVSLNAAYGIHAAVSATGGNQNNQFLRNRSRQNGIVDLRDASSCASNIWSGNTFATFDPACVTAP